MKGIVSQLPFKPLILLKLLSLLRLPVGFWAFLKGGLVLKPSEMTEPGCWNWNSERALRESCQRALSERALRERS